jgi:transglutaminase-like putative cysteine protease
MNYKVIHTTTYNYSETVSFCHNIARLIPRNTDKQILKNVKVSIDPLPTILKEYEDFFGNKMVYFTIEQDHKKLTVKVVSEIEKQSVDSLEFGLYSNTSWEEVQQQIQQTKPEYIDARQYRYETRMTTANGPIATYASQSFLPGRSMLEATKDLMHRIYFDFKFQSGFTTIATPLSVVMKERKGVCQDFAHLAIACIRSMGLPARYVSGYIETIPPAGVEKLVGVDASHAWFAVFIPHVGWLDFDPTNNQIPGNQHITIGWGRDYSDIAPLNGVILSSGTHKMTVSVDVRRLQ